MTLPEETGGPDGKANQEELFAAGYAACFHRAVKRVAAEKKITIGKSMVRAHVEIGFDDADSVSVLALELQVILPGAAAETAKDVARGARMICPYFSATRNNIHVKLRVTPGDGNDYDLT